MILRPQPDGTNLVVVQAADRTVLEKAFAILRVISKNETEQAVENVTTSMCSNFPVVLEHYPDTRRGGKNDPQKPLPGMEDKGKAPDTPPAK